jgi:pimeloyl-ACP methyl ester carboxylesterase
MMPPYSDVDRREHAVKDGVLSGVHFGPTENPIRLLMLHANGFNARSYRVILENLPIHSVSLDLRGHGFSTLPYNPEKLRTFYQFRDDVLDFIDRYVEGELVIAGHSLGASVGALCAPALKGKLKGFVGFDSPIMPFWMRPFFHIPGWVEMMQNRLAIASKAGRRRSEFDSIEQAYERYHKRGIFKTFSDDVLMDYVLGGLKPDGDGWRLACDPKWEQAIYPAHGHNLFKAARDLPKDNTQIIFATINAPNTFLSRERIKAVVGKKNVHRQAGFDHMFPLNKPDFAEAALSKAIKAADLGL